MIQQDSLDLHPRQGLASTVLWSLKLVLRPFLKGFNIINHMVNYLFGSLYQLLSIFLLFLIVCLMVFLFQVYGLLGRQLSYVNSHTELLKNKINTIIREKNLLEQSTSYPLKKLVPTYERTQYLISWLVACVSLVLKYICYMSLLMLVIRSILCVLIVYCDGSRNMTLENFLCCSMPKSDTLEKITDEYFMGLGALCWYCFCPRGLALIHGPWALALYCCFVLNKKLVDLIEHKEKNLCWNSYLTRAGLRHLEALSIEPYGEAYELWVLLHPRTYETLIGSYLQFSFPFLQRDLILRIEPNVISLKSCFKLQCNLNLRPLVEFSRILESRVHMLKICLGLEYLYVHRELWVLHRRLNKISSQMKIQSQLSNFSLGTILRLVPQDLTIERDYERTLKLIKLMVLKDK